MNPTKHPKQPSFSQETEAFLRKKPANFIHAIVAEDMKQNKHGGRVVTRFPPEPNGFLHIGHAKSICLNFGLAEEVPGARCHLRFDDTNPTTEEVAYTDSIKGDVRWLGFSWGDHLYHASDYFEQLYQLALQLIGDGKAYVCSLSEEDIRAYRGTVTEPGRPSPYRERSVAENRNLFERMRAGEFPNGAHVLRAKIDMASPNMKMRDPLLYRIRHAHHYRTGDTWPIYPMYDFAHCLSDSIEGVTHSLCTLEFENNREVYDWIIEHTGVACRPQQIEFARLNLSYTVLSKRKLLELVEDGHVTGWDDPRMPTLAGMRRRGYTPEAIRHFCERIGVAKANSVVDMAQLEFSVRDDLNRRAPRVMAVLRPLKLVIENYPERAEERLTAPSFPPEISEAGTREIPFSRVLYIERDDFMEHPPKRYHRLAPGREIRLRHAYIVKCEKVIKDSRGQISELRCTYDPQTLGVQPKDRKIKGVIHWVSARHALEARIRLYDRLFLDPAPGIRKDADFKASLNPNSGESLSGYVEPSLAGDPPGSRYQFERLGFFCSDPMESKPGSLVFNRTVALKDTWARLAEPRQKRIEKSMLPKAATAKVKKASAPQREIEPPRDPELAARFHHYVGQLNLAPDDARILTEEAFMVSFFEAALRVHPHPKQVANWVINELPRVTKDRRLDTLAFDGGALGELLAMLANQTVSAKTARDVLEEMAARGGHPGEIVQRKGLRQVSDHDALVAMIDEVLDQHPEEVSRYRRGEAKLLGYLVGQVMKASRGKANPKMANELLRKRIDTP